MKHSIRVKFTMIFIGLMAAVLVSMWAVNSFFLESFYTKQKLQLLENAYENLNAIAVDKEFLGENITEDLQSLYSNDGEQTEASRLLRLMNDKYNTTIVIQDSITGELIPLAKDGKFLADALHRYILGIIDPRTETLISQDDHQVQKIYDRRSQGYYLQSWGFFDDNRTMFIMSMPLASIHDSVSISNEFLAYVGLAALVLGSALMYYATKKVVSPIRSLAALSARMSELDFEARYTGDSEDEIGVLGHSMNTLSERLKDTIGELKTANNELQKDIEEKIKIDETRKEFIANVSHELKTPITSIQGYAELLESGMIQDDGLKLDFAKRIKKEAAGMTGLINDILMISRLESMDAEVMFSDVRISVLLQEIMDSLKPLAASCQVFLHVDCKPLCIRANLQQMKELFTNLATNAIKYNRPGGQVWITVGEQGDDMLVRVKDNGVGIPKESLDRIFERFYRVDKGRSRKQGGTGLGLSIVKHIVNFYHGTIHVTSELDKGTEFTVTIPLDMHK